MAEIVRPLSVDEVGWAESLFDPARVARVPAAPKFWRVAADARPFHQSYIESLVRRPDTIALRTDHAVLVAPWFDDHYEVDDMAVDAQGRWAADGAALLAEVVRHGSIRLVAPRVAEPERHLMGDAAGLVVHETWWLKDLEPPDLFGWGGRVIRCDCDGGRCPARL